MSNLFDTNYKAYFREENITITPGSFWDNEPRPPISQCADILKLSDCRNVTVLDMTLTGGSEDCIDVNRGSNIALRSCVLYPKNRGVTIKGSVDGWLIEDTHIDSGVKHEIELGQFDNYWYPGRPPTRNGCIRNCRSDRDAIRVWVWDADLPRVIDTKVKFTKVPKLVWYPYFLYRYCYVRMKGMVTK